MAFIFSWFSSILDWLGFGPRTGSLLFVGLDNAGKTTLLYKLKEGTNKVFDPTIHPSSEELEIEGIHFTAHDLGGHSQARRLWSEYYSTVDAVLFMVDASDKKRLHESRDELFKLLKVEELAGIPFAILGNKTDKPGCISEADFKNQIGISHLLTGKSIEKIKSGKRPFECFMCSVTKGFGYRDAFKWVAQYL